MIPRKKAIPKNKIALSEQLLRLADSWGDELALVEVHKDATETSVTRKALFEAIEKVAIRFHALGVVKEDYLVIAMDNCIEHIVASIAGWQLGACCVFASSKDSPEEKKRTYKLIDYKLLITDDDLGLKKSIQKETVREWIEIPCSDEDKKLPFFAHSPSRAIATGGSSGTPKLVVQSIQPAYGKADFEAWKAMTGQDAWDRQLIPGSLYHNLYNNAAHIGLAFGQTIYLMQKFNPRQALMLIEKHKIQCVGLVPTMMSRMMHEEAFERCDLGSLRAVFHSGGPCPESIKHAWINKIGAEKIYEMYAATEMVGTAVIRGDEWLKHQGSVGKSIDGMFQIRDRGGNVVSPRTIGEIYAKPSQGLITEYVGLAPMKRTEDGYYSVGDIGWMDEEGYLYISDRRGDMIVSGGKNVYTAEVENVLFDYPGITDAVAIGLPDEEWGRRVHAIITIDKSETQFSNEDLNEYLHARLSGYKCPKTIEIVDKIPRNEYGKVRRRTLVQERAKVEEEK